MSEQDLTPSIQDLMAQMAQMKAELDNLKARANVVTPALPQPESSPASVVSTTRRKVLRKLAGGILTGLAITGGAALLPEQAEARSIFNPQSNGLAGKVGAVLVPPGSTITSANNYSGSGTFGLIASPSTFDTNDLLPDSTAVHGSGGVYGVHGKGSTAGVYGESTGTIGVWGKSTDGVGVRGNSTNSFGVFGISTTDVGIRGQSTNGTGVLGVSSNATGVNGIGVTGGTFISSKLGLIAFSAGSGTGATSLQSNTTLGLLVSAGKDINLNTIIANDNNVGLYVAAGTKTTGSSRNAMAAIFDGNVVMTGIVTVNGNMTVNGTINGQAKAFKIDHPLDPANKYLYHTAIESSDMKNVYDGVVTLDEQGEAAVEMPDWFEALNSDFRYQLTALDTASPNLHIAQRLQDRKFKIAGGQSGQAVSWQVTGIRQDAWAKAHRIPVEEDKTGNEKGTYIHPELYDQPEELSVNQYAVGVK